MNLLCCVYEWMWTSNKFSKKKQMKIICKHCLIFATFFFRNKIDINLKCSARFVISSLNKYLKLKNEVWYPTIFSASLNARFHSFFESVFVANLSRDSFVDEIDRRLLIWVEFARNFLNECMRLNDILSEC